VAEIMLKSFIHKMKGTTQSPPRVRASEIFWSWVGACLGIGVVGYLNSRFFETTELSLIIGSFGASAVLIYGAVKSPLAQPRNLIGGHLISALIGVLSFKLLFPHLWLASALAVSTSIALMHATKTLHPPGGATALIAVIGGPKITNLGFLYALIPVGAGVTCMLIVALLINNIPAQRKYPEFWF
jgi:CBS-domain-containing membrane protein